jgi:hypothetical protein
MRWSTEVFTALPHKAAVKGSHAPNNWYQQIEIIYSCVPTFDKRMRLHPSSSTPDESVSHSKNGSEYFMVKMSFFLQMSVYLNKHVDNHCYEVSDANGAPSRGLKRAQRHHLSRAREFSETASSDTSPLSSAQQSAQHNNGQKSVLWSARHEFKLWLDLSWPC